MEPEGLLPHLQKPATCPCPELNQSSPCLLTHVLKIHFNITLPSTPCLSSGAFPSDFLSNTLYAPLLLRLAHSSWFDYPNNVWWGVQIIKLPSQSFHSPLISSLLSPNIFISTLFSNTHSLSFALNLRGQLSQSYTTTEKIYFCKF